MRSCDWLLAHAADYCVILKQVKAIGKTWHKGCLRCTECSTLLDSMRLTEKDGNPLCHRCYGKVHLLDIVIFGD